ncbi:sulfurtransferase complex subunit TusD [Aliiglaciecola litoralis]|uniref:Sulfurtransferase complex subunit TusD n=1 Tax=Aliiglaciecola litoralis TaxID=582857 RepID=A0ABN1LC38_9ALTE
MTQFCIIITSSALDADGVYSAYRFAQAVIDKGHKINGVFFYQSGVTLANGYQTFLSDERDMHKLWSEFASQYDIPLQVCVTAANRRGLISEQDAAEQSEPNGFNLSPPFSSVGLGELMVLLEECDRSIQF